MRLFLQKSVVSCLFLLACVSSAFGQLTVDFSASDSSGCGNVTPIFQDLTTSPGNPIVSWEWHFGDGSLPAFVQNPAHIYNSSFGCFDVTLIITTNNGTIDSVTKPQFICVNPSPIIGAITVSPAQACLPATMTLMANVTTATPISLWLWDITGQQLQNGQSITNTYMTAGAYDVTLLVQDVNGCFADSVLDNLFTVVPSPVVNFSANPASACAAPFTTSFASAATLNGGPLPVGSTYQWSFPGGIPANSTAANPSNITYNSAGNFDVTLSVVVPNGSCVDTLTQTGYIGVGQVISGITVDTVTCVGVPINLAGTGASTYTWDFDCNNTTDATGTTTTATFNTLGVHCIEVTGSNGPGCNDTAQVQVTVSPSPIASFTVDRTVDCEVPSVFSFDASASTGGNTYIWNFGAGSSLPSPYTTNNPLTSVTYTTFGSKNVTLTVKNASGCQDVLLINSLIQISAPNANFTANVTEGCVPLNVGFTSTSTSVDPITAYIWSFSPGGGIIPAVNQNIPAPTYQFSNPGMYDVRLIITTQSGCTDTLVRPQYLHLGTHPLLGMTYDDSVVCINEQIQFNSTFTNPLWQYAWDFAYTGGALNITSSLPNPLYAYSDLDSFSVALMINNNGCRDTLVRDSIIFVKGPKAAFSATPSVACGLPATFAIANNSENAQVGNSTYNWYFNNLVTPYNVITKTAIQAPVNPPSPTYGGAPQQLTIKLIVTGATTGCTDSLKQTVVVGNPIANFNVPDQTICKNTAATFTVTGSNASSYIWIFGDGAIDTTNGSTTHIYGTIDTFTVKEIAIDANACRDTLTKTLHIRVTGPSPNFTMSDSLGCTPLIVNFVNTTTLYAGTTQLNVSWDFGLPGGGLAGWTNVGQNTPTHIFTQSGTYTVIMRIRDSDNCINQVVNTVTATFPDTHFAADDTVTCAGNLLTFTPTIPGSTYTWTFGDSLGVTHITTGTGAIDHSYANVGAYTVSIKVTDVNGCVDSFTKTNYIVIESYSAGFTGAPTSAACPPLATFFQDQSTGNIGSWSWTFGDGSNGSTLQNPGHIYTAAGNFDVILTVTHVDGCINSDTIYDFITLDGPIGTLTVAPQAACPGDTVVFTVVTDRTQAIIHEPFPGDVGFAQTTTTGADTTIIKYVYLLPGTYSPIVQIQDAAGCSYNIPNIPNVTIYQPPIAAFDLTPPAGCTPVTISFTNNSVANGGATFPPGGYSWNFGNNTTSALQNPPSVTYLTPSLYVISLYLTDSHGCHDTLSKNLPANLQPLANFTADDTIQCAPIQIQFNDLTSVTVPVAWSWTFGDNTIDTTSQSPIHLYQQDGNYTVTLTVTDANGCKDTFTRTQYVYLRHPVANFVADSIIACNPFATCFNASSSQSDTLIDTYNWQFGAGQGAQLSNTDSICHVYNVAGLYTVTLTVTDVLGCSDDSVRTNYITVNQTTIPDTVNILRATVVDRNKVRVDFIPYFQPDFYKYVLYRRVGLLWIGVDSTTVQNTGTLTDSDPNIDCEAFSYAYLVAVQNSCRQYSPLSITKAHYTMQLSSNTLTDAVKLQWSAYKGWSQVLQYDIYKIPAGHIYFPNVANMVLLGSVSGNITTFTDTTTFCKDSVSYRINAIELGNAQQESMSDINTNNARHYIPSQGVEVEYATVYGDQYVEVKWLDYLGYIPLNFVLEKSLGGDVWKELAQFDLTTHTYIDTDVLVDSVSYRYRVFVNDACGDRSKAWNIGRNIVLEATQLQDETPVLNWNIYEKWLDAGVEYYEIQVWDENNGWVQVDVVGPQTFRYVDTKSSFFQSVYDYRIIAHELAGNNAVSVSNQDSVVFRPKIWGANAFTPNADGKNDIFLIKGPLDLVTFEMTIYDRWGRVVFNSRDITQGWDGVINGKPASEGVYTYRVSATGIKGDPIKQNGTVTLIR